MATISNPVQRDSLLRSIRNDLRGRWGLKAWNSKRSKLNWEFVAELLQTPCDAAEANLRSKVNAVQYAHRTGRLIDARVHIMLNGMTLWQFAEFVTWVSVNTYGKTEGETIDFINRFSEVALQFDCKRVWDR